MRGIGRRVAAWIAVLALAGLAHGAHAADKLRVGKPSAAGFVFALVEIGTPPASSRATGSRSRP